MLYVISALQVVTLTAVAWLVRDRRRQRRLVERFARDVRTLEANLGQLRSTLVAESGRRYVRSFGRAVR